MRIDYQTHNTTVVEYGPDGGAPVATVEALVDPGNLHDQQVDRLAVTTDAEGAVYVGIPVVGATSSGDRTHVVKIEQGAVAWDWTSPELGPDGSWGPFVERLMVDDDGHVFVGGTFIQPVDAMSGVFALFTAALDVDDGAELCLWDHSQPDIFASSFGLAPWPDGTPARVMTELDTATPGADQAFIATIRVP